MRIQPPFNRLRCHDWKQSGQIALWHYAERNRNYEGWHLTANDQGCGSLSDLIDAMMIDGEGATRSIHIVAPTPAMLAVPNCPIRKIIAPSAFRITVASDPNAWTFPEASEHARLDVGIDWLPLLRDGMSDIRKGLGDYSIGVTRKGSLPLWFWW